MTFNEWIGFKKVPDYIGASRLGSVIGFFIIFLVLVIFLSGVAVLLQFVHSAFQVNANHEAIRNIGLVLIAVLGAPFLVWRTVVAQQQADIARQSHVTEQITNAVAGLGSEKLVNKIGRPIRIFMGDSTEKTYLVEDYESFSPPPKSVVINKYHHVSMTGRNSDELFEGIHVQVKIWDKERTEIEWQGESLITRDDEVIDGVGDWSVFSETFPNIEVRIGAIYALERIAQDDHRNHIQVMEILTAYIRENSPFPNNYSRRRSLEDSRPRADVQIALDVIGRRDVKSIAYEHLRKYRLNLREVDLSGAVFSNGKFEGAMFNDSRFEASVFQSANLKGARFHGCLLDYAVFRQSDLTGAIFDGAMICKTNNFDFSICDAKCIKGISMAGSNFSAIDSLPVEEPHGPTFATTDTKFGLDLTEKREELEADIRQFFDNVFGRAVHDESNIRERLLSSGFLYWSPCLRYDGVSTFLFTKLREELGLIDFPYKD